MAGSELGSPVSSEKQLPCFQHSISRVSAWTSPSARLIFWCVQMSPRAYQSSSMRTTAIFCPSTTTCRAVPGATSATAHTRSAVTVDLTRA